MKKHLLLLAGVLILAPDDPVEAKAVKLGRGNAYSVAADAKINTGASADKKNATVLVQHAIQRWENALTARRENGPTPPVDNCYNVTCKDGYTTKVTSDGCRYESTPPHARPERIPQRARPAVRHVRQERILRQGQQAARLARQEYFLCGIVRLYTLRNRLYDD